MAASSRRCGLVRGSAGTEQSRCGPASAEVVAATLPGGQLVVGVGEGCTERVGVGRGDGAVLVGRGAGELDGGGPGDGLVLGDGGEPGEDPRPGDGVEPGGVPA
jgi:hypothetical protein